MGLPSQPLGAPHCAGPAPLVPPALHPSHSQAGEVISPLPRSQGTVSLCHPSCLPLRLALGEEQHQQWEKVPVCAACTAGSDPASCGGQEGTEDTLFYLHWSWEGGKTTWISLPDAVSEALGH